MEDIRYIKRGDLDVAKWDHCIDTAPNGLIYAYSFYLDAMCDNWDALVLNDYEAVMPLPWRKKWGIKYVYRPAFIQQLGVFGSTNLLSFSSIFLQQAMRHFDFGDYFLNYKNEPQKQQHCNLILNLSQDYSLLFNRYKTDLKNNLKKANTYQLKLQETNDYKKAITLYQQLVQSKIQSLTNRDIDKLISACEILHDKNMLCIREVINKHKELLAIALCLKDKRRIYFISSSTTSPGRKLKANHFLIDKIIQEFSASNIIFDFEGSDLPGVAHFYKNFGAIDQPYFFYRWNHLPWPLKLFKNRKHN